MLAVGFEEDVEVILEKLPSKRQNMLFSATMPTWVKKLARKYLHNPLTIDLVGDQEEKLAEGIELYAIPATATSKRTILSDLIMIIHYELPNDPETFVHCSGRTGCAGKEGTAILMFTSNQRRTVKSLEHDVGCRFDYISPPSTHEILESSSEQVVATLRGVHPQSMEYFLPTAQRLIEEKGRAALASALAHLSGFCQPPSCRSLITHEQGWITLKLMRDPGYSRGFFSARSVTGLLSDVYPFAADEVGKIYVIADEKIQGAVFDLPEDLAKELLNKQIPQGNTISKIIKLPSLQDDMPSSDNYGRFSNWDRGSRDGRKQRVGYNRGSRGRGDQNSDDENTFLRGGRSSANSWSKISKSGSDDDWLIGGGKLNRSGSFSSGRNRSFGGVCFSCGRSGHRASDCPTKTDY